MMGITLIALFVFLVIYMAVALANKRQIKKIELLLENKVENAVRDSLERILSEE